MVVYRTNPYGLHKKQKKKKKKKKMCSRCVSITSIISLLDMVLVLYGKTYSWHDIKEIKYVDNKKKSLTHFCYLLLKGKSLNPAYPPEGYEVKTYKQWRFWCFITKIKRRKEEMAMDVHLFLK